MLLDIEAYNQYDETVLNLVRRACGFRSLDDSIQCQWKRYAVDYSWPRRKRFLRLQWSVQVSLRYLSPTQLCFTRILHLLRVQGVRLLTTVPEDGHSKRPWSSKLEEEVLQRLVRIVRVRSLHDDTNSRLSSSLRTAVVPLKRSYAPLQRKPNRQHTSRYLLNRVGIQSLGSRREEGKADESCTIADATPQDFILEGRDRRFESVNHKCWFEAVFFRQVQRVYYLSGRVSRRRPR